MMKDLIVAFLVALVVGATINGFGGTAGDATNPDPTPATDGSNASALVPEVTENNFQSEVLDAKIPTVVDFYANWYAPCKQMNPILERLAKENAGKVKFVKLDVDSNASIASKYSVNNIPTFIFFKAGQKVDSQTGAITQEELAAGIKKNLGI